MKARLVERRLSCFSSWYHSVRYHSVTKLEEHMDTNAVPFPCSILLRHSDTKDLARLVERLDHSVLVRGVDVARSISFS